VTFKFSPKNGLILVNALVKGPRSNGTLSLALDTGATFTLINQSRLLQMGYDLKENKDRTQIVTGSGIEFVSRINVESMSVLGIEHKDFQIICHTLPPSAGIDGLLGLNFFKQERLCIDFRANTLEVE
jgi:predicted aspartyl protease